MTDQQADHLPDSALEEAARWLMLFHSGAATEGDARDFSQWRTHDAVNEQAFRDVARVRALAGGLPAPAARRHMTVNRRQWFAGITAMAASAAGVAIINPLHLWPSLGELFADVRTRPGQRRTLSPMANVSVELNSRSSAGLDQGGRTVRLISGEAFFNVGGPADPFAVEAGGLTMQAVRAAFNVKVLDDGVRISCLQGGMTCATGGEPHRLSGGEELLLSDGAVTASRFDPAPRLAWRRGLLIFEATPLHDVIDDINRYIDGRLLLTNDDVSDAPVSGVFHVERINNVIAQIARIYDLTTRRMPGGLILLG